MTKDLDVKLVTAKVTVRGYDEQGYERIVEVELVHDLLLSVDREDIELCGDDQPVSHLSSFHLSVGGDIPWREIQDHSLWRVTTYGKVLDEKP